jgi:hypothetical protein
MYGLHPDQLLAPAPVTELASRHPNHVWQIDASLCTLYCLGNGAKGLQGMEGQVYYKNKPGNLERVSANRVWRYVVTDHASGWLYVEYVLGAESGENLCSVFINAMQERGGDHDARLPGDDRDRPRCGHDRRAVPQPVPGAGHLPGD